MTELMLAASAGDTDRPARRGHLKELAALVLVCALALVAVAHVIASPRGVLLLSDGDSVLLELVYRSVRDGMPFHWAMSAVLFFFPEIPAYMVIRSLAGSFPIAAIGTALVNLVLLYALTRAVARVVGGRRIGPGPALVAYALIIICVLSETSSSKESFELVTLFLAGSYYWGVTLAAIAIAALATVLLVERRRGPWIAAASVVLLLAALSTMSNPLFVIWAAVPILVGLVLVATTTQLRWCLPLVVGALFVGGSVAGLLLRLPLARFVSPTPGSYVYAGRIVGSLLYYLNEIGRLAATPAGITELVVLVLFTVCAIAAMRIGIVTRRTRPTLLFVATTGAIGPVVVFLFNVLLGTETVRYLQPLYFSPILSVIVVGIWMSERWTCRFAARSSRTRLVVASAVVLAVCVAAVPAARDLARTGSGRYERVQCLEDWLDGRSLTGAGQFWDIRDLKAYGDERVSIVQVEAWFEVFPWLVNLADYYDADVSYVIVRHDDESWRTFVTTTFGAPAETVECPTYWILDYSGTPGEAALSTAISLSGLDVARQRGFLPR